jgi:hypothetical protein
LEKSTAFREKYMRIPIRAETLAADAVAKNNNARKPLAHLIRRRVSRKK